MSTSRISSLKQPPCYFSLTITVSSNDNLSALASELNPATVLRLPIVFFVYRRRVPSNGGELMGLESLEMLITDQKIPHVSDSSRTTFTNKSQSRRNVYSGKSVAGVGDKNKSFAHSSITDIDALYNMS
ncbi:PREDICTED: uncharacterized protein LOC106323986 [Brassica oleracea var. oleracea]|nr:PREDICTED: uncharacterized protein LOC106323986 [Brassica oleracea var. oleracea]